MANAINAGRSTARFRSVRGLWALPMLAGLAAATALAGCNDSNTEQVQQVGDSVYFNGMVYDGAVGGRITDYTIEMKYFDRTVSGEVDEDGRYQIGPLQPMHDFTLEIVSDGYRSFLSHNAFAPQGGRSLFFDAYLFPEDIDAEDAEFLITLSNDEDNSDVSGSLRLQPISPSLLYDDPSERPAGVNGQVWDNDEDLQASTVTVSFDSGEASVDGDDLVYGVTYAVTIFGVDGYQPAAGGYQAGVSGEQGVILRPLLRSAITLALNSANLGADEDGRLVLVFNIPIEFDPPSADDRYVEIVDGAFTISSPDADGDGDINTLVADESSDDAERGVTITIDENRMIFTWDPDDALESADSDDPINAVTYGGFDRVRVRPIGTDSSESVTLDSVVGAIAVTVDQTP